MTPAAHMPAERLRAILAFVQAAERLKDTLRSGTTGNGRQESTAEHCWRLCLLVSLFETEMEGVDVLKLLKLCLIHDLGEAISGDIPAPDQRDGDGRRARERADMEQLCAVLPADIRCDMLDLWDDYAGGRTREAVLAKGFDKIETMLQHLAGAQGADFDFAFNLTYARDATSAHPLLRQIRAEVDRKTRSRIAP